MNSSITTVYLSVVYSNVFLYSHPTLLGGMSGLVSFHNIACCEVDMVVKSCFSVFSFVFIMLLTFTGCGDDIEAKAVWEATNSVNTIFAYEHYLMKYPNSSYRNEVFESINQLRKEWHPALEDVKIVYLDTRESFPEDYDFLEIYSKLYDELDNMFNDIGIELVAENEEQADATLMIEMQGKALWADYLGAGYQCTGAIVEGQFYFIINKEKYDDTKYYGKTSPLDPIYSKNYKTESDAPFLLTVHNSDFYIMMYFFLRKVCALPSYQIWKLKSEGYSPSRIVVSDGAVYFCAGDKFLYSLDVKDGVLIWKIKMGDSENYSSPAVTEGTVFVGSEDKHIYAFNTVDGTLKWKSKAGEGFLYTPIVVDGTVFGKSNGDKSLYAINASDGSLKWKFLADNNLFLQEVADGTVYLHSDENCLLALDAKDGSQKWKIKEKDFLAVKSGIVYVRSQDDYIYTFDAADGKMMWNSIPLKLGLGLWVSNGTVYQHAWDSHLYALAEDDGYMKWKTERMNILNLDIVNGTVCVRWFNTIRGLDSTEGNLKWKFEREGINILATSDVTVYVFSDYNIYGLDAAYGILKWKVRTESKIVSLEAISDGTIYVRLKDDYVYAIKNEVVDLE